MGGPAGPWWTAKVQVVEHVNITPGGKVNVKSFNLGSCELLQGD